MTCLAFFPRHGAEMGVEKARHRTSETGKDVRNVKDNVKHSAEMTAKEAKQAAKVRVHTPP